MVGSADHRIWSTNAHCADCTRSALMRARHRILTVTVAADEMLPQPDLLGTGRSVSPLAVGDLGGGAVASFSLVA